MNYETDDEKVEAIKKWWQDNGPSIAAGLVLGLIAMGRLSPQRRR